MTILQIAAFRYKSRLFLLQIAAFLDDFFVKFWFCFVFAAVNYIATHSHACKGVGTMFA